MKLALISTSVIAFVVLLDNLRVRWKFAKLLSDCAERAADALRGTVLVGGVQLPHPDDERWTLGKQTFTFQNPDFKHVRTSISRDFPMLFLGPVSVGGRGAGIDYDVVYMHGRSLHAIATAEEKKYAEAVWRAFNSRTATKTVG